MRPSRVIAIDWSGARVGAAERIWWAERATDGTAVLENGRERAEVTEALVAVVQRARARGERVVIGLDFAFGVPAWYAATGGWGSGADVWRRFDEPTVSALLSAPTAPFWGRAPQRTRPEALREGTATPPLRATDREVAGIARPFSVFQLVGAGSVGTGALRGFATLRALQAAGACVWPFDEDRGGDGAVVLEVWPRLAAPAVTKSSAVARLAHAERLAADLPDALSWREAVRASDDAFDALVAMQALWASRATLQQLPVARSAAERVEGRIWQPAVDASALRPSRRACCVGRADDPPPRAGRRHAHARPPAT